MDSEQEFEKWFADMHKNNGVDAQGPKHWAYDDHKAAFTAGIRIGMERSAEIADQHAIREGFHGDNIINCITYHSFISAIRGEMPP